MKTLIPLFLCFLCFAFSSDLAVCQVDDLHCATTSALSQSGNYQPPLNVVRLGGKEITTQGVLRVLVVYVRFQDDQREYSEWPYYQLLPDYAQYFVDQQVPGPGGTYTPGNFSDFIDRASGGDGNGTLGSFKMIGDVYYVTTDGPRSAYLDDEVVHDHVFSKLDNPIGPYNVNFALYDNWTFISGGNYFLHTPAPDGKVDYIFMNWRDASKSYGPSVGGIKTIHSFALTNDFNSNGQQVQIHSTSGGTAYRMYEWGGPFDAYDGRKAHAIFYPGEEFFHYVYGGSHLDDHGFNIGNVNYFALMTSNALGNLCAYERYRAGWLNPEIVETNRIEDPVLLKDTHIKNKAVMIPTRRDASNNIVEYFLIENFHSLNDYSSANPFLRRIIPSKGLLVYHIQNDNLVDAMYSDLDIECADGRWNWSVIKGANTPSNRTDDLFDHWEPRYDHGGFDERDFIAITVPYGGSPPWASMYTDYLALTAQNHNCGTGNPCVSPCTFTLDKCNHGWRYSKFSWIGDREDCFREGETDIFSSYGTPSTRRADGVASNVAFEIDSYNPASKDYELKVAVDDPGVLELKPSMPVLSFNPYWNPPFYYGWIYLAWGADFWGGQVESDVNWSELQRKVGNGAWVTVYSGPNRVWNDNSLTYDPNGDTPVYFRVRVRDSQNKWSPWSPIFNTAAVFLASKARANDQNAVFEYTLRTNYPNPFNPSTQIQFSLADESNVELVVYDVLGRIVATLVNQPRPKGSYIITWDGKNKDGQVVSSGVYFVRLTATDLTGALKFSRVNKVMLAK